MPATNLLQHSRDYPFGLIMQGISSRALAFGSPANKYRFGSKENQEQEWADGSGLQDYDFGARFLDQQLGRWTTVDPLADESRRSTPYCYGNDNPLRYVDPDGMSAVGADGLTNEQWLETSRPGNGNLKEEYKKENEASERAANAAVADELRQFGDHPKDVDLGADCLNRHRDIIQDKFVKRLFEHFWLKNNRDMQMTQKGIVALYKKVSSQDPKAAFLAKETQVIDGKTYEVQTWYWEYDPSSSSFTNVRFTMGANGKPIGVFACIWFSPVHPAGSGPGVKHYYDKEETDEYFPYKESGNIQKREFAIYGGVVPHFPKEPGGDICPGNIVTLHWDGEHHWFENNYR